MALRLMEGSEAIAEAAVMAGCRFYSAYPMSPSTELLEHMAKKLPASGGVCINAETEIGGVNMALGAAVTGFRAASGSCGQGLSLMQEAIGEAAMNETPLVLFNMARSQQDYFQATRGTGWGGGRPISVAPKDVPEAVELTQLLFHLTDKYRCPGILVGDNLLARTQVSVDVQPLDLPPLPPKDWAIDGSMNGTGKARVVPEVEVHHDLAGHGLEAGPLAGGQPARRAVHHRERADHLACEQLAGVLLHCVGIE